MTTFIYKQAEEADWEAVAALLTEANLPLEGAHENLGGFRLAWKGAQLVGCAGLERYNSVGLLRSVAVRESVRGTGLGSLLTRQLLDNAKQAGITQVVLLTETAEGFFPKFGFAPVNRADVPREALASVEFTTTCPESALVMMRSL